MYKIKTFNQIASKGLDRFGRENYEVSSDTLQPEAILLRSHKLQEEDIPESVLAIARAGAGVNNVPVEQLSKRGLVVFNTPGANANAVKELVFAGMLLGSRGIQGGIEYVKEVVATSTSSDLNKQVEAAKKQFSGAELKDKTLGIVGLGAIGSLVADLALAFDMRVIGYDPALSVEAAWRLSSQVEKAQNLQSLLAASDYITLHVPAIPETQDMIDKNALSQVKKGAVLLNFARASIVNELAVLDALNNNQLSKYINDFPSTVFAERDDVVSMPHLGASTAEAEQNCAVMAADQLKDFLENGNIKNSVNFPTVKLDRINAERIIFANENVPKVLGNVLSILADHNVNVVDMVNKSRGELAYNIIDVELQGNERVIDAIADIPHVLSIRLIN
ncbi:MAG: phosphoglycerate dehydrogenase [Pseudomonadota bacterium]